MSSTCLIGNRTSCETLSEQAPRLAFLSGKVVETAHLTPEGDFFCGT